MTKPIKLLIKLPFCGFYESWLSYMIDSNEEQESEYMAEKEFSAYHAETFVQDARLRLDASEYAEIIYSCMHYSVVHKHLAREYVPSFNALILGESGIDLRLEYESMDSPREYNFSTDRVYAHIPLSIVKTMYKCTSYETLSFVITRRFTSYDGFSSFYSNDIAEWIAKPVKEWDHNELETLLIAFMSENKITDIETPIAESMNEDIYTAFDSGMDWDKFNAQVEEKRQEKLDSILEDEPGYQRQYPDTETKDLFNEGK